MADSVPENAATDRADAYEGSVDALAAVLAALIDEVATNPETRGEMISRIFTHADREFRLGLEEDDPDEAAYREGGIDLLARMRAAVVHKRHLKRPD